MAMRLLVVAIVLSMAPALRAQTERPAPASPAPPPPHILCGMRVFPANPGVDAEMEKPTPPGMFTLRTRQPRICRQSFPTGASELKRRLPQIFGPKR